MSSKAWKALCSWPALPAVAMRAFQTAASALTLASCTASQLQQHPNLTRHVEQQTKFWQQNLQHGRVTQAVEQIMAAMAGMHQCAWHRSYFISVCLFFICSHAFAVNSMSHAPMCLTCISWKIPKARSSSTSWSRLPSDESFFTIFLLQVLMRAVYTRGSVATPAHRISSYSWKPVSVSPSMAQATAPQLKVSVSACHYIVFSFFVQLVDRPASTASAEASATGKLHDTGPDSHICMLLCCVFALHAFSD